MMMTKSGHTFYMLTPFPFQQLTKPPQDSKKNTRFAKELLMLLLLIQLFWKVFLILSTSKMAKTVNTSPTGDDDDLMIL